MGAFTRTFKKIIPSLRQSSAQAVHSNQIKGEKIQIGDIIVYLHKAKKYAPVLFELHGGGFALGEAAKDDELCEKLKDDLDINVVGIDYRLCPEFPYPAAVEDVINSLKYFSSNKDKYNIDTNKFILMGYSAGANLATVATMKSYEQKDYNICLQILHYPFLDATEDPYQKQRNDSDLPAEVMEAFNDLYATKEQWSLPYVSPLLAEDNLLKPMPQTLILTADRDTLKNQGQQYAHRLKQLGVNVKYESIQHAHHGYIEDYYNKACYDINADDAKASHDSLFGEAAQKAINIVEETIKQI